jgi:CBS domain-containing protein
MKETISCILDCKGRNVWSVEPDSTVYNAIALMADKGVGALIVAAEGRIAGIISERDYARKVILQGKSSKDTLVRDIMTRRVITVTPEHTVGECMQIMTEQRIRHLPVLDGSLIAGMISIGDLVKAIISDQAYTIEQLHVYITGGAFPT